MSSNIHAHTPEVTVLDNRGLTVRTIGYHRHPETPDVTDERITRHQFDARGHLVTSIDPRLFARQQHDKTVKPNVSYLTNLTGDVIRTESPDAGITVSLSDIARRPHWSKNAVGALQTWQYEADTLPGRLLSVTEQPQGESARITERVVYAGHNENEKAHNLAGQAVRHYDTAGLTQTDSLALTGTPLAVTRQLPPEGTPADWQGTQESAWQTSLSADIFTTHSTADATGATLTHTDTKGHQQRLTYDVAGLLTESGLTLKGQPEQIILKSLTWSAAGQKLREAHGNGVVTTYRYEPETQRLTAIKTERPTGHAAGVKVLQDLRYTYDPVGNVLRILDEAEPTRFWRNQKVVPENTYTYDSLYQLVKATGREKADIKNQGISPTAVSIPLATDNTAYTTWTRSYTYDNGNNLTRIRHHAPASGNTYTTEITVSHRSNRAVLSLLTKDPAQVDSLFDAGGHQTQLQKGQPITWTARGELLKVMPVVRDEQADDAETYRYDATSQRVIKTTVQQTGNSRQTQRVVYLPNLELRTTHRGEKLKEALQVITVGEAGRAQVRVLHWEAGKPDGLNNNQLRYSYDNLIGSSTLELDGKGEIISLEEYYPYGGTAVWTARNQTEADYKTRRYSGKERDTTGLYYYGYRYYQPWVGRWLSSDPAGTVDGLNLYRMLRNNPINHIDKTGKIGEVINEYKRNAYATQTQNDTDSVVNAFLENRGRSEIKRKYLPNLGFDKPSNKLVGDLGKKKLDDLAAFSSIVSAPNAFASIRKKGFTTEHELITDEYKSGFANIKRESYLSSKHPFSNYLTTSNDNEKFHFISNENKSNFINTIKLQYEKLGIEMHKNIESAILDLIKKPMPITAGIPGLHAEVLAVNDRLNSFYEDKEKLPVSEEDRDFILSQAPASFVNSHSSIIKKLLKNRVSSHEGFTPMSHHVFTKRLTNIDQGHNFAACHNCTGILSNIKNIKIETGITQ
ncbi:RHS repeat-associated core domain-containing protein [Candidatus Williamhamiltonella defendens]|uniref:RHS repeat-associated core domain-containing protein n=1 Tax=Candidatus Williamhamiltonella defendens TaxID=138072 RepID=UPI0015819FAA|nr:RHS repeat-associated core domain-containing protein [Candidatus Hamiltonella defensa]